MSGQASASGTTGRKGKEISVFDKGRIVGWHEGVSKKEIGHRLIEMSPPEERSCQPD